MTHEESNLTVKTNCSLFLVQETNVDPKKNWLNSTKRFHWLLH